MKIKKSEIKTNKVAVKPKRNFTAIAFVGIAIIALFGGIAFSLSKLLETETFYVLNTDVQAKAQITPEMLLPQETAKGTAPQNAVTLGEVQQGTVYAKYPLSQGDVIANSNAGPMSSNFEGIPDDWSVMTISVNSDNALNGQLARGDYFDIMKVDNEDGLSVTAKYVATNVLVLDVAGAQTITNNEDGTTVQGASLLYTVGMDPKYALAVQAEVNDGNAILTRSPISARYQERNLDILNEPVTGINDDNPLKDLMEGTDPTFSPVIRDKNSRPVNEENCLEGKISPANLCEIYDFSK